MLVSCNKCKRRLELSAQNFYRSKTLKRGFAYACKKCAFERSENWRLRNLKRHSAYQRAFEKNWRRENRRKALLKIGGGKLSCVRCGDSRYELLEINHKNGGGTQERKTLRGSTICSSIIKGRRRTDDLELLCRPCNLVHAAELLSGKTYRVVSNPRD